MRHRRGPISYSLSKDAPTADLRAARAKLTTQLETALRASLGAVPPLPPAVIPWQPRDEKEPSIWRDGAAPLVVNRGHLNGSARMTIEGMPRGYARLIPSTWKPIQNIESVLEGQTTHPIPLGDFSSLDFGSTKGGFLAYRASKAIEESGVTPTATRWFRETGEFWGVASDFFDQDDDELVLSTGYAVRRWMSWFTHSLRIAKLMGAGAPFSCELGLEGLDGATWPAVAGAFYRPIEAVEDAVRHDFVLEDADDALTGELQAAFVKVSHAFGLTPFSREQFDKFAQGI
jgi:hypothetical protein